MRILEAFEQFLDGNGDPISNGWIKFLKSGTTSTLKDTYADSNQTILNANPLQLDGEGRVPDNYGTGTYRVVVYTHDEVAVGPGEQVAIKDPVGGNTLASDFSDWDAVTVYSQNDIVTGSDGTYYKSLVNNNENNEPSISPSLWTEVTLNNVWNGSVTYSIDDTVVYEVTGQKYISLTANNLNNIPSDTLGVNWKLAIDDAILHSLVPVGTMVMWTGLRSAIPTGWILCGQAVSRTTYAELFATIGTLWGVGDGSTTFDLPPDSKFPIAADDDVGGSYDSGDTGGSLTIAETNLPAHNHGAGTLGADSDGNHTHTLPKGVAGGGNNSQGGFDGTGTPSTSNAGGIHTHSVSGATANTGGDTDYHQPYMAVPFIIKY